MKHCENDLEFHCVYQGFKNIPYSNIRIILDEIFRILIINMYITHCILNWDNHNLILFYGKSTNRNLTCAELMRKAYQLGRPWWRSFKTRSYFFVYRWNDIWHVRFYMSFYYVRLLKKEIGHFLFFLVIAMVLLEDGIFLILIFLPIKLIRIRDIMLHNHDYMWLLYEHVNSQHILVNIIMIF